MLTLNKLTYLYEHLPMRFDLRIETGERVAILGPSGAGKSTLLGLVAGFLAPVSGQILLNGSDHTATPPAKRPVSMLFQENNLFSHLTVRQNMGLGLHPGLKLSAKQKQDLEEIARQVGLSECLDRLPSQLSGGQRQRVALARALVMKPKILLLDEPTSALDSSTQVAMVKLLRDIQAKFGLSYIFISHDLQVIKALCQTILVLKNGEIQAYDTTDNIFTQPQNQYVTALIAHSSEN